MPPPVSSLVINSFGEDGIRLETDGENTISGNYIGTDVSGTASMPNGIFGLRIVDSAFNTIGGTVGVSPGGSCTGDCNLISGNGNDAVHINGINATENEVIGNFIGTDVSGTVARANGDEGARHIGLNAEWNLWLKNR